MSAPERRQTGMTLGGSTVLTVLLVLCLSCFALLTWSRARTAYSYSQRTAQTVSDYYAADSRAEELLALLVPLTKNTVPSQAGPALAAALEEQDALSVQWDAAAQQITFALSAGAQGDLTLVLALQQDGRDTALTTLSRRVVSPVTEDIDSGINVFIP